MKLPKPAVSCLAALLLLTGCTQTPTTKQYVSDIKLAVQYHNQRDYASAEQYHRKAVEGMRDDPTVSPDRLAVQINNLAAAINQLERPEEARALLREATEILQGMPDPDNSDIALVQSNLAESEERLGNYTLAEELYRQSLLLWLSIENAHPAMVGPDLAGLARVLARRNEAEEAAKFHNKAREYYTASYGPDSKFWQRREAMYKSILKEAQSE